MEGSASKSKVKKRKYSWERRTTGGRAGARQANEDRSIVYPEGGVKRVYARKTNPYGKGTFDDTSYALAAYGLRAKAPKRKRAVGQARGKSTQEAR